MGNKRLKSALLRRWSAVQAYLRDEQLPVMEEVSMPVELHLLYPAQRKLSMEQRKTEAARYGLDVDLADALKQPACLRSQVLYPDVAEGPILLSPLDKALALAA
jgi:hypothetical protein